MAEVPALVDPEVSRAKFEREIAQYRAREDEHLRRGWLLLKASFPEVFVVFATAQVKPPGIVFGAVIDFTNYDYWPPSVRLVDPFTREPYAARELPPPAWLPRRVNPGAGEGVAPEFSTLMQAHDLAEVPFLCLPGVREYHQPPGHSGDSWLLHRGGGEGTLYFLLEKLHQYGIEPVSGYGVNVQVSITGFAQREPPA